MHSTIEAQQYSLCVMASVFSVEAETETLFRGVPCPQISKLQYPLSRISCHNRAFEFHKPINLLLYEDEGVWVCEWDGILSAGGSATEAAFSFCEDFSTFWDEIAQLPDSSLTTRAQATKSLMLSVVKSVE